MKEGAAVLALKAQQAEGVPFKLMRKVKAYGSVTNAMYRGLCRGSFIWKSELVSESKKVVVAHTDFLNGRQETAS
jgi:hypothetical protein